MRPGHRPGTPSWKHDKVRRRTIKEEAVKALAMLRDQLETPACTDTAVTGCYAVCRPLRNFSIEFALELAARLR